MTELKPCPFCGGELAAPTSVQFPRLGLARLHPGSIDDGSCPIAGWGFYEEQLTAWNTRADSQAELVEALERIAGERTVKFDGSEPTHIVEIARAALARVRGEG